MMKPLILFLLLLFCSSVHATHVRGAHISYAPTGNLNEYEITLNVYRDCAGVPLFHELISIKNSCGFNDTIISLGTSANVQEISQICTNSLPNTNCNNGNIIGVEKHTYSTVFTLPGACSEWTFSWIKANRTPNVNTTGGIVYIETKLNNLAFPNNSSPTIGGFYGIPYVCAGQPIDLSLFVQDSNSDSLDFSFTSALSAQLLGAPPFNAVYVAPFTATLPIPAATIDSLTGKLSFNAPILGNYVIAILIKEYDCGGVLIGSTVYELQVIVQGCNSPSPIVSDIQNFNNFGSNASFNGNIITASHGDQFCFDIVSNSASPVNTLDITTDILSILPTASVTTSVGNPSTTTICWTYTPYHFGNHFTVQANDNNCPILGIDSKAFLLDLPPSVGIMIDTIAYCGSNQNLVISNSNSGQPFWYDMNGVLLNIGTDISCNPCLYPNFLFY